MVRRCKQEGVSRTGFVYNFRVILQVHIACQDYIALGMGTCDRLVVWMMAEMLAVKVLFEVAATGEGFQASTN